MNSKEGLGFPLVNMKVIKVNLDIYLTSLPMTAKYIEKYIYIYYCHRMPKWKQTIVKIFIFDLQFF